MKAVEDSLSLSLSLSLCVHAYEKLFLSVCGVEVEVNEMLWDFCSAAVSQLLQLLVEDRNDRLQR